MCLPSGEESACTLWRGYFFFAPAGNRTLGHPLYSLVTTPTNISRRMHTEMSGFFLHTGNEEVYRQHTIQHCFLLNKHVRVV
jgi:hypothetical protein